MSANNIMSKIVVVDADGSEHPFSPDLLVAREGCEEGQVRQHSEVSQPTRWPTPGS